MALNSTNTQIAAAIIALLCRYGNGYIKNISAVIGKLGLLNGLVLNESASFHYIPVDCCQVGLMWLH